MSYKVLIGRPYKEEYVQLLPPHSGTIEWLPEADSSGAAFAKKLESNNKVENVRVQGTILAFDLKGFVELFAVTSQVALRPNVEKVT